MLLFHHIPKTAGTSLLATLRANFDEHELIEIYGAPPRDENGYRHFFEQMPAARRERIKCLSSHTANLAVRLFDVEPRIICLVREPLDRAVSLYHFLRGLAGRNKGLGSAMGDHLVRHAWRLRDIYECLGSGTEQTSQTHWLFRSFFDGQTRALLAPHDATGSLPFESDNRSSAHDSSNVLRPIFGTRYTFGITEQFDDSLRKFANEFGWTELRYVRQNETPQRPALEDVSSEVAALVLRHNRLDVALHRVAAASLDRG